MNARTILVTGANGFIGKSLVEHLSANGDYSIICASRRFDPTSRPTASVRYHHGNLLDDYHVTRLMACDPDVIIHLAANPIVKMDERRPSDIIEDNVVVTHNLLARSPEGCIFVNASSVTVYGSNDLSSLSGASETSRQSPCSVYGASKAASEHLVNAYTSMGRVRGINIRLVANVGPDATHGLLKDIIRKLGSKSPTLELLGDHPGSCKPFLHVDDTSQAFILAASDHRWLTQTFVNISPAGGITVERFAKCVMDELGIHKPITWLGENANWKGDNRVVIIDSSLARSLGWSPNHKDSESAVRQAVKDISRKGVT